MLLRCSNRYSSVLVLEPTTRVQISCTRTRTRQMSSKLPDADVSAVIFLKCNVMSLCDCMYFDFN